MATATAGPEAPIDTRTLTVRGAVALASSLVATLLLLGAVEATDAVEPFQPLSVPSVAVLTAVGAIGATVVYWAIARRSETPNRTFTRVAAGVLVLSFLPDLGLLQSDPAATVPAVLVLMAMRVAVAAICVAVLTGRIGEPVP